MSYTKSVLGILTKTATFVEERLFLMIVGDGEWADTHMPVHVQEELKVLHSALSYALSEAQSALTTELRTSGKTSGPGTKSDIPAVTQESAKESAQSTWTTASDKCFQCGALGTRWAGQWTTGCVMCKGGRG